MSEAGSTLPRVPSQPVGTLPAALAHAARLLSGNPRLAAGQATEILRVVPDQPDALLILGVAQRRDGDPAASRSTLDRLVATCPASADARYELGLTLAALGHAAAARRSLERATELNPRLSEAWRALGDQFTLAGDVTHADEAYARHIRSSTSNPRLMEAAAALVENRLAVAERLLRAYLKRSPTDVAAIRMLAELGTRLGRYGDAENLLARCLELAPSFTSARYNYALVLYRQGKSAEALVELDRLISGEPNDPNYLNLQAAALGQIGEYERAIEIYDRVLKAYPDQPKAWMSYGHALKTARRPADCIAAYRRSIALQPSFGEAYWSLANLKTFQFSDAERDAIRAQLARPDLGVDDRLHFHFALGKALEDAANHSAAFEHYAEANRLRRGQIDYDADDTTAQIGRSEALFTEPFFAARAGLGSGATDPIFIVGLPRSGSTLIEQILASHSAVEGTMELPDIGSMARVLSGRKKRTDPSHYPEILAGLTPERLRELGDEFIERTRVQRKTGRPFFIDKMPHNFLHVGLIHLILPHARIIDARRHPLATCFSAFKQHFARGQTFSYDQTELGRYYRDYVDLMAHFDHVLPGRIHRVHHETLVAETETTVRRLLDYCGLPFEPGCLRFHENERAVRTASSEQVRRPIFTEGLEQWRHFEPWLGPLKAALGPVLEAYPGVPETAVAS